MKYASLIRVDEIQSDIRAATVLYIYETIVTDMPKVFLNEEEEEELLAEWDKTSTTVKQDNQ